MTPMIGLDVSYSRNAFKSKVKFEGFSSSSMLFYSVLEGAAKSVQAKSDNRWIVANKAKVIPPFDKDASVELMIIVPAGNDQYEQFLSAIALFEEFVAESLGMPVDTTRRTIEEDEPHCKVCSKKPDWVRHTQTGHDDYFCTSHAHAAYDFFTPARLQFWEELKRATT